MAILGKFYKQPAEVLDYEFDFSEWLADRADSIVSQTVVATAQSTGSAMTVSNVIQVAGVVRFFLAGGTEGVKYKITCTIVTTGGRTKQSEIMITVKDT